MCLLTIQYRAMDAVPVIVAANREEAYDRGGESPRIWTSALPTMAGVDPRAGGTWLGVNAHGLLVAVTNRRKADVPNRPRSRGLLAVDLLQCADARAGLAAATRELEMGHYAGCNVLCADPSTAYVIHAGDWLRVRPLPPGIHVLTAHDTDDESDPRIRFALEFLSARRSAGLAESVTAMQDLCRRTDDPPICLHGERGGTVSSSIIALPNDRDRAVYLHAQGSPDRTSYVDLSALLRGILQQPAASA